jgi:hypothetical protein
MQDLLNTQQTLFLFKISIVLCLLCMFIQQVKKFYTFMKLKCCPQWQTWAHTYTLFWASYTRLVTSASTCNTGPSRPAVWSVVLFFSWRLFGFSIQAWMPTYVRILRIPQVIWVWRATVEWYTDRKNRRTRRKPCPSATLSTTNPTWTDPGEKSGLRGQRPVTNDLSHGTAIKRRSWSHGRSHCVFESLLRHGCLSSFLCCVVLCR